MCYDETICSLRMASMIRKVKNQPIINCVDLRDLREKYIKELKGMRTKEKEVDLPQLGKRLLEIENKLAWG